MQIAAQNPTIENGDQVRTVVTVETVAILVLIASSMLLRLISLGSAPVTALEVPQALAALRSVSEEAPGTMIAADSPILYWIQRIMFGLLGSSESVARLGTAFAGVALGGLPLLFRGLLGRARAYIFAVFLTVSPILLVGSRFSAGAVWSMFFAGLTLWAIWRYWDDESRPVFWGTLSMVAFGSLLFLSEPGGPVLGVVLLGAGVFALFVTALIESGDRELPGNEHVALALNRFREWPWGFGLLFAGLVIVATSTGFLLDIGGFNTVSALLERFLEGFSESDSGAPDAFPLVVSLFYEPWSWVIALSAVIVLYRRASLPFLELFFVGWALLAVLISLIYPGGKAAHGLWLSVPLAGLSSFVVTDALVNRRRAGYAFSWDDEGIYNAVLGKWILASLMLVLLLIVALQLQVVSRFFLTVPDGSLSEYLSRLRVPLPQPSPSLALILLLMSLMSIIGGAFVGSSFWGNGATWQGAVTGVTLFVLASSVGVGWNVAVANADNPAELWHHKPPSRDLALLRETILDLSLRETHGEPLIPIAIMAEADSLVAWQVRDFPNARFVDTVADAQTDQVVLMPVTDPAADTSANPAVFPELGAAYVGQRFVLSHTWSTNSMRGFDFLPWWVVRDTRTEPAPADVMVLWVRQDIFDSEPYFPDFSGSK